MHASIRPMVALTAFLLAVIGGLLPLAVYWFTLGSAPSIAPATARDILARQNGSAMLVDIRLVEAFRAGHIDEARNWPYLNAKAISSADDLPTDLRGKRLLIICESGILSRSAVQQLTRLGIDAVDVAGGMQAWLAAGPKPCLITPKQEGASRGEGLDVSFRESPTFEQWMAVLTGFVVKPAYTFGAFLVVIVLWRRREPDLAALRWAMISFFVGENFCAANYLLYDNESLLFEYLHSFGMVLCFALVVFALLEAIDRRLLRLTAVDQRCAAVELCGRCIKHADVPCRLRQVFLWLMPAILVLTPAPWCASLVSISYNTQIMGDTYNYSHPVLCQIYETRFLPIAAAVLLAIAWALLRFKRSEPVLWSKMFFASGVGAMGFSFLRLILFQVYRENQVWFTAWEEVTELLLIWGVIVILCIFRRVWSRRITS